MTTPKVLSLAGHPRERVAAIQQAAAALSAGQLVVLPTDTCYAVAADAFAAEAIAALRQSKGASAEVPLPVGCGSVETAHGVAVLEGLALDLASAFWPGPLTLIVRPQPSLSWALGAADAGLAVRVPGDEVCAGVLAAVGPCVLTGAQQAGQSPPSTVAEAVAALGDAVALYLDDGDRTHAMSSVVDATGAHLRLLREGALSLEQMRDVTPMLVRATA